MCVWGGGGGGNLFWEFLLKKLHGPAELHHSGFSCGNHQPKVFFEVPWHFKENIWLVISAREPCLRILLMIIYYIYIYNIYYVYIYIYADWSWRIVATLVACLAESPR